MTYWRTTILLALLVAALILGLANGDQAPPLQPLIPSITRCDAPADERIVELARFSHRHGLPGVQIAYVDPRGRPVACASGWARYFPLPEPMSSRHRLRYASLSKLFTAATTLRFVAAGKLRLEDRLLDRIGLAVTPDDRRIAQVTLAQLLNHTAGFAGTTGRDPMAQPSPWCPDRLAELRTEALDDAPGERFNYSNLGYCLLGAVLAANARQPIDQLFGDQLLRPFDAQTIKPATRWSFAPDEPDYFFDPDEGHDDLLAYDYASNLATGGWSGNAKDMAILLAGTFGPRSTIPATIVAEALSVAETCDTTRWRTCHAFGLYRYHEPVARTMFWRDGSLPGVTAFAALFENGETIVLLANRREHDWKPLTNLLGQEIYRLFAHEERSH